MTEKSGEGRWGDEGGGVHGRVQQTKTAEKIQGTLKFIVPKHAAPRGVRGGDGDRQRGGQKDKQAPTMDMHAHAPGLHVCSYRLQRFFFSPLGGDDF